MIISFSEVLKWDTCQRQYFYSFGLNLRPIETSGPINIGTKGHKLLQGFYTALQEGKTYEQAVAATTHAAELIMKKEKVGDFTLLKAWVLVDNYIRAFEPSGTTLLVENRFLIPVTKLISVQEAEMLGIQDVQIGFTPDLVTERTGGFLDVEDYKFVGRAWPEKKINRFPQAKLYHVFLKAMGYKVSRSAVRFFNTETSKVSLHPFPLSDEEEKTLTSDFIGGIADVVRYRKLDPEVQQYARRTMNYTACQFCYFEFPCTLESRGKSAKKTLENQYVKSSYDYNS